MFNILYIYIYIYIYIYNNNNNNNNNNAMDFMVFSSQIKQPYMLVRFKFHVKCKAIQFYFGGKS